MYNWKNHLFLLTPRKKALSAPPQHARLREDVNKNKPRGSDACEREIHGIDVLIWVEVEHKLSQQLRSLHFCLFSSSRYFFFPQQLSRYFSPICPNNNERMIVFDGNFFIFLHINTQRCAVEQIGCVYCICAKMRQRRDCKLAVGGIKWCTLNKHASHIVTLTVVMHIREHSCN